MSLSEAQKRAVAHAAGPCICLAGPGSGKTTVITQRVKYLIENRDIPPAGILVITFTKAAATEMRERFTRLMGGKRLPVTFGTFHAVFFGILKNAYGFTAANILREEQKHQYLKEIIDGLRLEIEDEGEFLSGIIMEISTVKNNRISLDHYYSSNCSEEVFRQIYEKYQQKLQYSRLLDFDDMLVYTYELLKERKDIREGWQRRFPYILIDEFQDINQIQYDIVRMLAAPGNNLFIVGDDDQSIYRFRGARPEIMLNFKKDYPEAELIRLELNYRSTENIIKGAGRVISNNSMRYPKEIHGVKDAGEKIEIRGFITQSRENTYLAAKVKEYLAGGYRPEDVAVLFRTNTGAQFMVSKFMEYNLPFRMRDILPNIYDHWIAKDFISYIKMSRGSRERKDFLKIINRPKRYIGREALDLPEISFDSLREYYRDKEWMEERINRLEYDLGLLKQMPPFAAINFIRKSIGYEEFLFDYAQYRRMKPEELYEIADELQEAAKNFKTCEAWFAHMEEYAETLKSQAKEQPDTPAVTFTTLHSAKGLEFPIVFLADVNEGNMPHRKAMMDADIQEERRLFYVGMTRAKEHLHIYYAKEKYGKTLTPSRYIEELINGGQKRKA